MSDRATRQYELDWLRLLAVASVMGLHLAETYARPADDPTAALTVQSPTLGYLIVLTSYWRMPILFCIAGMVAMHTRGRRTLRAYVLTRAERLLLPLVLGLAVLNPIQLALEGYLTGVMGVRFAWAYLWFLGALAVITACTIPVGAWLAYPAVQQRLARGAGRGSMLAVLGILPLAGTLFPYRWAGTTPVIGHVDLKTFIGYGGDFVAGMVLASTPAFRATVQAQRGHALLAWAVAAVVQVAAPRLGVNAHVPVLAEGVASWAWVLACYGFATRYLARSSRVITRWAPRALAIYVLHGIPLAAARDVVLPPVLPLPVEVTLLVAITVFGALSLVRLAEADRRAARVFGLRYSPLTDPRLVIARRLTARRSAASLDG